MATGPTSEGWRANGDEDSGVMEIVTMAPDIARAQSAPSSLPFSHVATI